MLKKLLALCVAGACFVATLSGCAASNTVRLDPKNPVTISVWHYYNGAQQAAFSALVDEFNRGEGQTLGIQVKGYSQGSVSDLAESVTAAANDGEPDKLPSIFAAYADTAYQLDQMGVIADISTFMKEEERALYLSDYLSEGNFSKDGGFKIFPVAKSTEVLTLNRTDWDVFAAETGAQLETLSTMEGVTETARAYYEWTDAQTPGTENDGKAFFGRDAFANYMLIGAKQLGTTILNVEDSVCTLDFNKETARKLWDNYYVPMVAGWFAAENRFRSDDVKLGTIIACVGSTSGATYFPETRIISDTESVPIEMTVLEAPRFEGGEGYAVQQGAGFAVTQKSDEEVYASVAFLKWFTQSERNARFSVSSGYLPVTLEASTLEYLSGVMDAVEADARISAVLSVAVKTVEENTLYTPTAFETGAAARAILDEAMPAQAAADRAMFLARLEGGETYAQLLAEYSGDAVFDAWYADMLAALEAAVG